jgi:membrane fusion protein (multidrug efflux system)
MCFGLIYGLINNPLSKAARAFDRNSTFKQGNSLMQPHAPSSLQRRSTPRFAARDFAAFAILLPLLGACDQKKEAATPPPPPAVGVEFAAMKGVSRSDQFIGRIKSMGIVEIRARVEGFLEKVLFTEGQDVTADDLLYQIEKDQYQAQVDQAKANLAAAEAQATNTLLQYNRSLQLVKNQYTPQATVDQNKAAWDTAKAQVLQAQAALTQTQINLAYTDIRAPIDGRIGRTAYTVGNLVNPASGTLVTIVSQDPIYVLFPVSQRQLEDIRKSRRQADGSLNKIQILVTLSNGDAYPLPGVWNFTDPQVDQQTDTLIMRATLPNPDRLLVDGAFVSVEIRERKEQPRLVVPQAALQVDQAGYYVLIVNAENKVEQRRVTIGPNQGLDAVIQSGLGLGEKVIVEGVQKVRPGQLVKASLTATDTAE